MSTSTKTLLLALLISGFCLHIKHMHAMKYYGTTKASSGQKNHVFAERFISKIFPEANKFDSLSLQEKTQYFGQILN